MDLTLTLLKTYQKSNKENSMNKQEIKDFINKAKDSNKDLLVEALHECGFNILIKEKYQGYKEAVRG